MERQCYFLLVYREKPFGHSQRFPLDGKKVLARLEDLTAEEALAVQQAVEQLDECFLTDTTLSVESESEARKVPGRYLVLCRDANRTEEMLGGKPREELDRDSFFRWAVASLEFAKEIHKQRSSRSGTEFHDDSSAPPQRFEVYNEEAKRALVVNAAGTQSQGSDRMRIERIQRLHTEFMNAADKCPALYHVACRSEQERLWRLMVPRWLRSGSSDVSTQSELNELEEQHDGFWLSGAVEFSGLPTVLFGDFAEPPHLLAFDDKLWVGRYANPMFKKSDKPTPYFSRNRGVAEFETLSEKAFQHFADLYESSKERFSLSRPLNELIEGRNRWLEFIYRILQPTCECGDYNNVLPELFQFQDGESYFVVGLSCNVFLASARAIEMIIDRQQLEILLPPPAPKNQPSNKLLDNGNKKRPAYERDHLWLKWNEDESLTPAKIRDRWDDMTDEDRKATCPGACDRVSDGSKKAGREVVVKGIKKARGEKAIQNSF